MHCVWKLSERPQPGFKSDLWPLLLFLWSVLTIFISWIKQVNIDAFVFPHAGIISCKFSVRIWKQEALGLPAASDRVWIVCWCSGWPRRSLWRKISSSAAAKQHRQGIRVYDQTYSLYKKKMQTYQRVCVRNSLCPHCRVFISADSCWTCVSGDSCDHNARASNDTFECMTMHDKIKLQQCQMCFFSGIFRPKCLLLKNYAKERSKEIVHSLLYCPCGQPWVQKDQSFERCFSTGGTRVYI